MQVRLVNVAVVMNLPFASLKGDISPSGPGEACNRDISGAGSFAIGDVIVTGTPVIYLSTAESATDETQKAKIAPGPLRKIAACQSEIHITHAAATMSTTARSGLGRTISNHRFGDDEQTRDG